MKADAQLAVLRDIIQRDPGNRGLARDPQDNLFTALPTDFAEACLSLAHSARHVGVVTGFFIPTADPPAFETDGPHGTVLLAAMLQQTGLDVSLFAPDSLEPALRTGLEFGPGTAARRLAVYPIAATKMSASTAAALTTLTHLVFIECVGPAEDGRCYSMRGRDVTDTPTPGWWLLSQLSARKMPTTIGIGDGGNEIGMGKLPHSTIQKNVPLGDRIHCRVATDFLVVSGVSNWGAVALAAGVGWLRGADAPMAGLDADAERRRLERMVTARPLVDGVTGKREATVDGLSWNDYVQPLVEMERRIRR